jgi:hypothetical protein
MMRGKGLVLDGEAKGAATAWLKPVSNDSFFQIFAARGKIWKNDNVRDS